MTTTDRLRSAIQAAEEAFPDAAQVPVVISTGDTRWLLRLAESANQPTDLPDGVSPWLGDEADAVAIGHIVQTLPDDEWERSLSGRVWFTDSDPNAIAMPDRAYLLRRKPQTVTVELPKDVAEGYSSTKWDADACNAVVAACRKALGR